MIRGVIAPWNDDCRTTVAMSEDKGHLRVEMETPSGRKLVAEESLSTSIIELCDARAGIEEARSRKRLLDSVLARGNALLLRIVALLKSPEPDTD